MEETRNNGVVNIGFDPGFGGTKAAWICPSGAQVVCVPSVVGVGQTDLGLLSIGGRGQQKRSRPPDQVNFGGSTYLVGESVARYARPIERMGFQRLGDGPELRPLFYAVTFHPAG